MKIINYKNSLVFFLLMFSIHYVSFSQTFSPDSTFNGTGIKTFTFYNNIDRSFGCALQPDQKLVMVGLSKSGSNFQLCFARLNVDGSFDSTFQSNGKSYVGMGPQQSIGGMTPSLKITTDGKIIAVNSGSGGNSLDIMICRLDSSGNLDLTFNNSGILFVDMLGTGSQPDMANAFDLDANGNIYAIGATRTGGTPLDNDFAIIKVNSNGVLDSTFDGDGKKLFDPTGFAEFGRGIKVQNDGKIVFGGTAKSDMMIARMDSTGAMDPTFNGTGYATVNFGNFSDMMALDRYPDGRIIVAGTKSATTSDIAVARYLPDGTPDSTFGINGKASFDPTISDEYVTSMIIMSDNRILLGGYASQGSSGTDFMLARLDTTGNFDTTFNHTGYLFKSTIPGNIDEEGNGIALMNDGRIIIGGTAVFSSAVNEDISFLRIKQDSAVVNTGIPENSTEKTVIAYPNPCLNEITINCDKSGTYSISDITGRVIINYTLSVGSNKINIEKMEKGIYFIKKLNTTSCVRFIKM